MSIVRAVRPIWFEFQNPFWSDIENCYFQGSKKSHFWPENKELLVDDLDFRAPKILRWRIQ